MRNLKRGLVSLLALVMLISSLPVYALAAEETDLPEAPPAEETNPPETPAAEETAVRPEAADEIVYHSEDLGMDVIITGDEDKIGTEDEDGMPHPYVLFDEDGSYTIPLKEGTSFPIALNFSVGEKSYTLVFGNEGETNKIGDHVIAVSCCLEPDPEPEAADDLYVVVNGEEIPVVPEEAMTLSMMPLEEKRFTLDLQSFFPDELKEVSFANLLSQLSPSTATGAAEVAAWSRWQYYDEDGNYVNEDGGGDDYTLVGADGTIDLSQPLENTRYYSYLELIVGTADPLNTANKRYIITVYTRNNYYDLLEAEVYSTAAPRAPIDVYDTYLNISDAEKTLQLGVNEKQWNYGQEAYLGLELGASYTGLTGKVYLGYYDTVEAIAAAGAAEITSQIWNQTMTSSSGGYRDNYNPNDSRGPEITLVLTRTSTGKTALVLPLQMYMYQDGINVYINPYDVYKEISGTRTDVSYGRGSNYSQGYGMWTFYLPHGTPANETYYVSLGIHNPANPSETYATLTKKAVKGYYRTASAVPASAEDIKAKLFTNASLTGGGFGADYSGSGVVFTIVDKNDDLHWIGVRTVEEAPPTPSLPPAPEPLGEDTYFRMTGARKTDDTALNAYVMPYNADGYYYNGFQTVLLLNGDGSAVAGDIRPEFDTGYKVDMFAGTDMDGSVAGAVKQTSGVSEITLSAGPIPAPVRYSAAAENGSNLKNYWVTFLTQQSGPCLFVNAANDEDHLDDEGNLNRVVYLTEEYGGHHDIFFANIGDAPVTGLSVTLSPDAQNVALDGYWKIHDTTTLSAFTTTEKTSGRTEGELANVSKIRLVPQVVDGVEQAGEISGTLTIAADGIEPIVIKLTGVAGAPKITTDTLRDGIRYVHYSCMVQTNNMSGGNSIVFQASGLPQGLTMRENGEIYGVPTVMGTFPIQVTAASRDNPEQTDTRSYDLVIQEDTYDNVESANLMSNQGYPLTADGRIPDVIEQVRDETMISEGSYAEFMNVYLDGRQLTPGTEYNSESGSTKITVQAQTIRRAGNGPHTISAEFRTGHSPNGVMRRTAQKFTITGLPSNRPSGGGGGGGSSRPAQTTQPAKTQPAAPTPAEEPKKTAADVFDDINEGQWFYPDVDWAYQDELILGVTGNTYRPYDPISQLTATVVIARMDGADLTPWEENVPEGIPAGQWYTGAASWAKNAGILPEGPLNTQPPMPRGEMAVMLVKYLQHRGIDCSLPSDTVAFTDAAQMTPEENDAFQVLYQFGIFKGIGNYTMDVSGSTTRAQFAVLLHRLSVFAAAQQARG